MWDTQYRPLVFSDVLGQDGNIAVLRARLKAGRAFDTSYIFEGGYGCGKTTLSRILARSMLCQARKGSEEPCNECDHCKACLSESMDAVREVDAASQGTTADMRRLVDDLAYNIPGVPKRIITLDEAHRMSNDAQDVLLKPIEDGRLVVIFCTTERKKIRDTIKSRCETYELRKIQREEILTRMQFVLAEEKVEYEEDAVLTLIDHARGHVRDILKGLETVSHLGPVSIGAVREHLGLTMVSTYYEIFLSLGDPNKAIRLLEAACDRVGPIETVTGMAEAAMNSYRQAHKIHADFATHDKEQAKRLYEAFGDNTTKIAQYFLRGHQPTRLSLVCDVLALCESGGVPVASAAPQAAAPVLVPLATPSSPNPPTEAPQAPAPTQPAAAAPQAPAPTPTVATTPQAPAPTQPAAAAPIQPVKKDIYARGIRADMPRGANLEADSASVAARKTRQLSPSERPMTPEEVTLQLNKLRGVNGLGGQVE